MKPLEEIKNEFPETTKFIDDDLEQEYRKENMTRVEVVFLFTCLELKR